MNKILLTLLLVLSALSSVAFAAEVDEKKVIDAIEKKQLVAPGVKILAKVGGGEAVVSTYGFKESKDRKKDCKIDATLMAKELFINNDFGLARLTVDFYEPDGKGSFNEVIVTRAEVKALASNLISMEEYLDSLRIVKRDEGSNNANTNDASAGSSPETDNKLAAAVPVEPKVESSQSESKTSTATFASIQEAVDKNKSSSLTQKDAPKACGPRFSSVKYGYSFDIPNGWVVDEDVIHKDGKLLRLSSRASRFENNIEFYYHAGKSSAAELALGQRKTFNYGGCKFERYEQAEIGQGSYRGALVVVSYPHESGEDYYEMHCYFGNPGAVYDLRGWCPKNDYRRLAPAFWQIMNSVKVANLAGAAKNSTSKPAAAAQKNK